MYCEACGATLPPQEGRGRRRLVCNDACWQRLYRRRQQLQAAVLPPFPCCLHGRFQAYAEAFAGKIDVIITDPPYANTAKNLRLYADLGQFALTTLVPGGWLLCLTGWGIDLAIRQHWLELGLEFVTVACYHMPSGQSDASKVTSTGRRVWQEHHKPLLWFEKRGTKFNRRRAGANDLIMSPRADASMDQAARTWEQSLAAFLEVVRIYTNTPDVICDPLMGWGTTLEACVSQARQRVIGIELLRDRYEYACQRVGQPRAA